MSRVKNPGVKAALAVRFQGESIHQGQKSLLEFVRKRHYPRDTLIVVGFAGGVQTKKDPIFKEMVAKMIEQTYRGRRYQIRFLKDHAIDSAYWSRDFDKLVEEVFPGEQTMLYGARDSFIASYSGKHKTVVVPTKRGVRGTKLRAKVALPHTRAARASLIYASQHRPDFMYATSDLAIIDYEKRTAWLIGKNAHEGLLSFCGGHAQKGDRTGARCATRERGEEVKGIRIGKPVLVDVLEVEDPRYRGTKDGVMTSLYLAPYLGGTPRPDDDADVVAEVKWKSLSRKLVPWHRPLAKVLLKHLKNR